MQLPSIDSLRCFMTAARLLNFRAAARAVGLTPAAFGQRIKQLEGQLGTELFQRTTRRVHLTESGLALVPAAERCLAAAEDCVRAGASPTALAATDVVVGTRHELGLSWVLPQLDALAKGQPPLLVHLYFGSGPDLLLRVRTMEIDCAITSMRFSDAKLEALRLHREDYAFVGARALLAKVPLSRVEHAAAHTLLDIDATLPLFHYFRDAGDSGDARLRGERLRFSQIVRLGTVEAIRRRVLAGAGVAVLPEYLVRGDLARRRLTRIFPSVTLLADWFRLVFRADDARRSVYQHLAEHISAVPLG